MEKNRNERIISEKSFNVVDSSNNLTGSFGAIIAVYFILSMVSKVFKHQYFILFIKLYYF